VGECHIDARCRVYCDTRHSLGHFGHDVYRLHSQTNSVKALKDKKVG